MVVPEMLSSMSHRGARAVADNLGVGTEHSNRWCLGHKDTRIHII